MSAAVELLEDVAIKQKVTEVWEKIFAASSRVVIQAQHYGFSGMELPAPNIHEMLVRLQIFTSVIDILINHAEKLNVSYDDTRLMLNAKEQLTRMERLAAALRANNRSDFEAAIRALENQAPF